jgi:hypothetical protein
MSTDIERYHEPAAVAVRQAQPSVVDSWIQVVADVSKFATYICDTDFVPAAVRGNAPGVAAIMLAGREMGIPPMMALQHIHLIKGRPGQSAQLMRGMVQSAGHEIKDVETTDARCVLDGRRRGEEQWTRVTYTADQARRASIDIRAYPEDKLYARATTRLCRRKFADVIGGLPSIDDLEDGVVDDGPSAIAATPAAAAIEAPKRTAKRRTSTRTEPAATVDEQPAVAAEQAPAAAAAPDGPPLPGEAGYDGTDEHSNAYTEEDAAGAPAEAAQPKGSEPATGPQLTKLHTILNTFAITERADKLTTVALLVRRELESSKDLTKAEANGVIDLLERLSQQDDPAKALDAVLAEFEAADQAEDGA